MKSKLLACALALVAALPARSEPFEPSPSINRAAAVAQLRACAAFNLTNAFVTAPSDPALSAYFFGRADAFRAAADLLETLES